MGLVLDGINGNFDYCSAVDCGIIFMTKHLPDNFDKGCMWATMFMFLACIYTWANDWQEKKERQR